MHEVHHLYKDALQNQSLKGYNTKFQHTNVEHLNGLMSKIVLKHFDFVTI